MRHSRELLADVEPEDGDGARSRAADGLQVYSGEAWGGEADAVAEQDRQDDYQNLVDEAPGERVCARNTARR